jgi:tryptophan-rich sensory protein
MNLKKRLKGINYKLLIPCLLVVFSVAFLGSLFTMATVHTNWYTLIKPTVSPPNWVFPVVWSILFMLIAISLYLCMNRKRDRNKKKVLIIFSVNLFLNILWPFLFFYMKNPMLAYFEIIILWFSIILMMFFAYKTSRLAAYLLIPYFFWVSFANALNYLAVFQAIIP